MTLELDSMAGCSPESAPASDDMPAVILDATFESGQVHIWRIDLDHPAPANWEETLCAEEFHKAKYFVQKKHQDRFLLGRSLLRKLLSVYTGAVPRELEIRFNEHGKPYLPLRYCLGFNLSHSENQAVIAIGRNPMIGIDIERLVLPWGGHVLAQQILSPAEYRSFTAMPDDALLLSFLTCWTRKEALVKALGVGLTSDLRAISVGFDTNHLRIHYPTQKNAFDIATMTVDDEAVISLAVGSDHRCGDTLQMRIFQSSQTFSASNSALPINLHDFY
jgi:4'-phosphopantetheinyl transferase